MLEKITMEWRIGGGAQEAPYFRQTNLSKPVCQGTTVAYDLAPPTPGADTGFFFGCSDPPPYGCLQYFFYIQTHRC